MKKLKLIAAAIAVAGAMLGTWLATPVRATAPAGFSDLAAQCASFTRFYGAFQLFVSEPYDELDGTLYLLHLAGDGRLGVDRANDSGHTRYAWSGGELTYHAWHLRNQDPLVLKPGLAGAALSQLWSECRGGFSQSTWYSELPPAEEWVFGRTLNTWARLELPFAWASTFDTYVSIRSAGDPQLRAAVLVGDGWHRVAMFDVIDWNATYPDQVFSPLYPLIDPPIPEEWYGPTLDEYFERQ